MTSIPLLRITLSTAGVLVATCGLLCAEPMPKELRERAAAQLVEQALQAELAGDTRLRRALLDEALRVNPAYSPARWQSGQIFFDGCWRNVGEVSDLVTQDHR